MSAPHVDPSAFASLAGEARGRAIAHLGGCPDCRAALAAESPESLFSLLALEPVPPELLDAVSAGVARRLEGARPSWIEALRERGLPRSAAGLAAAAAVVACALLLSRPPRPAGPVAASAAPPRADVSLVEPAPAARVIDLTVGETQFVMIFDPELQL